MTVSTMTKPLCTELAAAHPRANRSGREFWVFQSDWGDDYAESEELPTIRSIYEADGIPFTIQHFPAAPVADELPDETWGSHPSLTAEARN
jgi:hypothetical protein